MIPPSAVTIFAEYLDHGLEVSVHDRQQNPGRPVGNLVSQLPLLKGAGIEAEATAEFLPAQPEPLAQGDAPA